MKICMAVRTSPEQRQAKFVKLRPPKDEDERVDLRREELRRAFDKHTKAIIRNTPNNPGPGKVFTRSELELIGTYCIEFDVLAITNEVYGAPHPLRRDEARRNSLSRSDARPNRHHQWDVKDL